MARKLPLARGAAIGVGTVAQHRTRISREDVGVQRGLGYFHAPSRETGAPGARRDLEGGGDTKKAV